MRFRKKPVVIDAIQWSGSNWHEVYALAGHNVWLSTDGLGVNYLEVKTPDAVGTIAPGDWLIKGIKGDFYPCKPDIFEATYEPVSG
jgi:hypothetical protein